MDEVEAKLLELKAKADSKGEVVKPKLRGGCGECIHDPDHCTPHNACTINDAWRD
jgi:hypothetical protein